MGTTRQDRLDARVKELEAALARVSKELFETRTEYGATIAADAENIQALADEIQRLEAALERHHTGLDPPDICSLCGAALTEEGKTE